MDELSWAGGIFDGEGSISVGHRLCKWKDRNYLSMQPKLEMQNTNKDIVVSFANILSLKIGEWQPKSPNRKKIYYARVGDTQGCLNVAKKLEPYIIGKKEQIKKFIEFCESRINTISQNRKNFRASSYTENELQLSEEISKLSLRPRHNPRDCAFYKALQEHNFNMRLPVYKVATYG
jgi:hypothetical protein